MLRVAGALHPGVCDVPEETLPLHHGGSGSRQGPAQERPAPPRDAGHHAVLSAVLRWVSRPCHLFHDSLSLWQDDRNCWPLLVISPLNDSSCIGPRNVSQELSETILTMVANCSNVMNKARQPPPGVMPKGRAPSTSSLDAISPVQVSVSPLQVNYQHCIFPV